MYQHQSHIALAILAVLAFSAICLAEDTPDDVFQELYGDRIKKVKATRSFDDDIELAKEWLAAAQGNDVPMPLKVIFCERAFESTKGIPNSQDIAIESMAILGEVDSSRRTEALTNVAEIHQRQYNKTRDTHERKEIGNLLIEEFAALAALREAESDWPGAVSFYRRARSIAARVKSPYRQAVDMALETASARQSASIQIKQLVKKLESNPDDAASAKRLVMLYVVDLDQPAKAIPYTDRVDDDALTAKIKLVAANPDDLTESDTLTLAKWYKSLATSARGSAKVTSLHHAVDMYDRFLELHSTKDLAYTKAELALASINAELEKPGGSSKPSWQRGLLIHYTFDEKTGQIRDHSGNNKHATNRGAVYSEKGKHGGAYVFDESDYMELPRGAISDLQQGSVAMWVYINSKKNDTQFLNCVTLGGKDIHVQFRTGHGDILTGYLGTTARLGGLNTSARTPIGKWTHLAWAWTGETCAVYIDGRRVAQIRNPQKNLFIPKTTSAFNIGRDTRGSYPAQNLRGAMDDLMVFNRAIGATEVKAVAQGLKDSGFMPLPGITTPRTRRSTLREGLVLHYPFDKPEKKTITDQSKAKINGAVHGVNWTAKGKINGAAIFDGKSYIDIGNPKELNFDTNDFSVSLWFNAESKAHRLGPFLSKGGAGSLFPVRPGYGLYHQVNSEGSRILRWDFGQRAQNGRARVQSTKWSANVWHHMVMINRDGAIEAYLDGNVLTTNIVKPSTNATVTGPEPLLIGKQIDNRNKGWFLRGMLDDVRIYNRALMADEITRLFRLK